MYRFLILDTYKASFNKKGRYNASSKPRTDAIKSLNSLGGKRLIMKSYMFEEASSLFRAVNNFALIVQFFIHCGWRKENTVFMQYPFTDGVMMVAMKWLKRLGNRLVVLIHDIESLRQQQVIDRDKILFDNADVLIVHSSAMAEELQKMGYEGKTVELGYFDYVSDIDRQSIPINNDTNQVVFAGNLQKSAFLTNLHQLKTNGTLSYFLYGVENKELVMSESIEYKGCFDSEHFETIEGNWGLVWDGDSINTCSGKLGDYLKINAPFKLSLYLAAQLPVIVWSESAMAEYVKKYHLGITIDSLEQIPMAIASVKPEEYTLMRQSVKNASYEVRSGQRLKFAFCKALEL